jgi:hypothetical protein
MARGKLTMKRCPNGKRRSCPKKAKKCTLKRLSAKAKTFKLKTKKALNAKAKTFSMKKGGKKSCSMKAGKKPCSMKAGKKKAKKKAAKKGSYIKFMSCEIKKIKKQNPKMSHKAAFKKAASNWSK